MLKLNMHSGKFSTLPGLKSLNPGFDGGFGLGFDVYAGFEKKLSESLLLNNDQLRLSMSLGFSNLSADFSNEEMFAHIIEGNSYKDAVREHILETSVNAIILEPGVVYYPDKKLPVAIKLSAQIGIPSGMSYYQAEKFVSPVGYTFENGQRISGESKGDIQDAASLMFGLSAGVRYELHQIHNFLFSPELKFCLGLTDLAQGTAWKANSVSLGVNLQYQTYTAAPKPAMPAPMPPMPAPPIQSDMEAELTLYADAEPVNNDDIVSINVVEYTAITRTPIVPRIYFDTDSKSNIAEDEQVKTVLRAVTDYLRANAETKVSVISTRLNNVSDNSNIHLNTIETYLNASGIESDRIDIRDNVINRKTLNHEELSKDYSYIEFVFADGHDLLYTETRTDIYKKAESKTISIKTKVVSEAGNISLKGKITGNNFEHEFSSNDESLEINDEFIKTNSDYSKYQLSVSMKIIDGIGQSKTINKNYEINPNTIRTVEYNNPIIKNDAVSSSAREYILGFFDYDRSVFSSINDDAVVHIKKALEDGKSITIIPSTDHYGTNDHNEPLARRRAESALRILGNPKNSIIKSSENYKYSNENPYGRMMNRSVIVIIH